MLLLALVLVQVCTPAVHSTLTQLPARLFGVVAPSEPLSSTPGDSQATLQLHSPGHPSAGSARGTPQGLRHACCVTAPPRIQSSPPGGALGG